MNIRHFFDNIDEKTIDRITEKYPPLSSDDKERLYAMSKNKYNSEKKENKNDYSEVMGVERYRKPVWQKVISAVAAAVVVLGGIGGGAALIRRNNDADILKNESSQLAEIEDIAQQLTDEFFDLKNIISSRGAAYDENDILTYKIGIFDETVENPDIHDRTFFRVTDERFKCSQDIYDALKNITSSKYFPEERYENAIITWEIIYDYVNDETVYPKLFYNLGTDVSMFENGSEVGREYFFDAEGNCLEQFSIDFEDDINWEVPHSIWFADYVEYNGSLYVLTPDYFLNPVGVVYDYNEKIEITDVTNDSFTVIRYADISHNENIIKRAEFKFILENDQWCIDDFSECVLDTEGIGIEETDYTAIATELTDKLLEFEKIVKDADVEYDENDSISFYRDSSVNPELEDEKVSYCRVTDERFNSCQDIYNYIRSFTSFGLEPKDDYIDAGWLDECSIFSWLSNDFSEFEIGDRIDSKYYRLGHYISYRGQLYVVPIEDNDYVFREYTSDVTIKKTGENSFTATRSYTKHYVDEDITSEKCFDFVLEAGKWKIDKVYLAGDESEDGYDYTAIATELTDKLLELENTICYGDISYDENERKAFTMYTSDNSVYFDQLETIFYKVTDPRFSCRRDLYDELRSIFTKQRYDENDFSTATIFGFDLNFYLGSELSDYIVDGKIDIAENFDNDDESICYAVYCDINGELYVRQCDFELSEYTSDVIIKETGENSFTATRSYRGDFGIGDGTSNRCFDFVLENGEWKIDKVYFSDEESEDVTESDDEYEYLDIAGDLTDKFFYMIDVLGAYNVSYDENDFITYNCYSVSNPATLSEKYGVDLSGAEEKTDFLYTRKLYKVTDDRFKSCQDIYNALRELTSSSLLPEENYENADLPIYGNEWVTTPIAILGTDVSMYESGSNIYDSYFSDFENRKFDMQDSDNWEAALSAFGSHYVEYNGNLYIIGDMGYSDMPDVHVNLQNVEENRFSVTRKHIISYEDETKKIESYNFDFVFENGEWKIDNVERVVSDEEAIGIAIASYVGTLIRSDTDKYGNIYENPEVFDFGFEIVSYNGENNCTARVILTDYDYVDIIELTAEIDIKEQKVINAEIIELQ
ncbi:MAG: hypothetical protein IJN43_09135 [Ruminococcus sp.]|nr:hypothetical protein [Ruminococcus sp.]